MSKNETPPHIQAWREESYSAHGGSYFEEDTHMYVGYCVFEDGVHVYPSAGCIHYNGEDEFETQPGWTVLDNRRGK